MNLKNLFNILDNQSCVSIACENGVIFGNVADIPSLLSSVVMNSVVTKIGYAADRIQIEVKDFSPKHITNVPDTKKSNLKRKGHWNYHPNRDVAMELLRRRYKKYGGDLTLGMISMMSGVSTATLITYTKAIENEAA